MGSDLVEEDEPSAKRPRDREPYSFGVLSSPLDEELRTRVHRCMCDVYAGDFRTNGFGEDQLRRLGEPGAVYAFAQLGVEVVACAMAACDGSVGLVGGVCTRPEHRRRGLSRELIGRLLSELEGGPRWLVLGTGSPSAARIYAAHGFQGLNGGLGQAAKGYNPEDEGEWIMVRDAEAPGPWKEVDAGKNEPFDLGTYIVPGEILIEPLHRRHWGAAVLLLNAADAAVKLRAFGVDDGLTAELRLARAVLDGEQVAVAVHAETRRVYGIAFRDAVAGLEVYNLGPAAAAAALVAGLPSVQAADVKGGECAEFWERGYLVFPGLLAEEAPELRRRMDELLRAGEGSATADWNAVNTGGAEFVLATDENGRPMPDRVMKVQGAALGSAAVLQALAAPEVCRRLRGLYGHLGQEVPSGVDVFGTKFFPMWPGGTSVHWHQDCHYFGTGSPRIISCGIYLEDTDSENGCFRVIPGSHTRGEARHAPGTGTWAQGEWAAPDESAAVDIAVPAGSVVLFNAMLVHGAHRNSHPTRTRYSIFGHFVPASLGFAWRGTDFSHGVYKDRHTVY